MFLTDFGAWFRNPVLRRGWVVAGCACLSACTSDAGTDPRSTDDATDAAERDTDGGVDLADDGTAETGSDDATDGDSGDDDPDARVCEFGYDAFGVCCDDRIFERVDGERMPVAESAIFMRFDGCPCDPALASVMSRWWCADALITQAMRCGNGGDVRRWVAGSVERSDFDGPPLECTWELLAAHTGEYPDQGL